jgi:hypothetical protein
MVNCVLQCATTSVEYYHCMISTQRSDAVQYTCMIETHVSTLACTRKHTQLYSIASNSTVLDTYACTVFRSQARATASLL